MMDLAAIPDRPALGSLRRDPHTTRGRVLEVMLVSLVDQLDRRFVFDELDRVMSGVTHRRPLPLIADDLEQLAGRIRALAPVPVDNTCGAAA